MISKMLCLHPCLSFFVIGSYRVLASSVLRSLPYSPIDSILIQKVLVSLFSTFRLIFFSLAFICQTKFPIAKMFLTSSLLVAIVNLKTFFNIYNLGEQSSKDHKRIPSSKINESNGPSIYQATYFWHVRKLFSASMLFPQ